MQLSKGDSVVNECLRGENGQNYIEPRGPGPSL